jgi:nucleotide-binding universal stress UspA family protein
MTSYARILVGVDGSGTASLAADRAIELAAACGAELHVVDVVVVPSVSAPIGAAGADVITDRVARADDSASEALEAARRRAEAAGVAAVTHLVHGEPAAAIVNTAASVGADVIVVGNRGVDASGHYVLGSIPEAVLHGARCDVLVAHTTDH